MARQDASRQARHSTRALPGRSRRPLGALAMLAVAAIAAGCSTMGPAATQTIAAKGLSQPAEIRVDRWGVPHIYAANEDDVFYAQGWNAARDRLFQIDLFRRRGLGQLAEVFGPQFVEQDRATRMFLFRGDMDAEWRIYDTKGTRAQEKVAQRFVQGINAYVDWLAQNPDKLPWEFRKLGYQPARWAAEDVVRIRSHGLTRNLSSEVMRAATLCRTGDVDLDQMRFGLTNDWRASVPQGLDPCLPQDVLKVFTLATQSVRVNADVLKKAQADAGGGAAAREHLLAALETVPATVDGRVDASTGEPVEGSNSWTVAPSRSATGRPILANDPHRAYSAPSLRYLAHISAPGLDVIGAGEPALPGISLGHNGTIAFGLTIFNIDQEDLYVYELQPGQSGSYRYGNAWEPMRVVREQIAVRGEAPRTVEMAFTRHGPVIHVDAAKNRAYAVRSGWLEMGMSPYFASLDYMRAKDFETFRKALTNFGAPTLNQVYADVGGNIGWVASGLAPIRKASDGLLPVPGDGRYEWQGIWRGPSLPWLYNPAKGFIATANGYNIPDDYPAKERKLGFEWTNPARMMRVHEVLDALPKISIQDSERLQNDVTSIPARRLGKLVAGLRSDDAETARAIRMLANFDGVLKGESNAAALAEVWQLRHLRKAFKQAALGDKAEMVPGVADMNVMLGALEQPQSSRWFAAQGANAAVARDRVMTTSLRAAWDETKKLLGDDPAQWQWGKLHHNFNEHAFASAVDEATRSRINVGPIPKDGSEYTPSQSLTRATDFRQMNGPSARIVIDVGNWDGSRAVNHPGQSGDPDSAHYRDLAKMWRQGEYFPLVYSRKAVEQATEQIIRLEPAR